MRKTLNKILSTDLQRGSLLEAIALNSDSNTKIIVLYPLDVTPMRLVLGNMVKTLVKNMVAEW